MKGEAMIDVLGRGLCLLVLAGLVLSSGCSSEQDGVEGEDVFYEDMPETESVGTKSPANFANSGANPQEDRSFAELRQERSLAEQQRQAFVDGYLAAARGAMENNRFEDAEKLILRALEVNERSLPALQLLRDIRALRGDPVLAEAAELDYIASKRRLVRQQQIALVNDSFAKANRAIANGDFEAAKRDLDQARVIIDFDPYRTDFGDLAREVNDSLSRVETQLALNRQRQIEDVNKAAYERVLAQEQRERARRDEQVQALLEQSVEAFNRGEFDRAELLAEKVLRQDASQTKAREILEDAEKARHANWRTTFYERRRQEYQTWLEQVRATQIPSTELIQWADVDRWNNVISKRSERGDAVDRASEDSEAIRRIKAKLDNEIVSFEYGGEEEVTFSEVIDRLRVQMDANIVVDPEVMSELAEEPVSIVLLQQNLGSALRTLLANVGENGLAYTFRNDVLFITTKEKALAKPFPRVYEVRDLTVSLPNFTGPDLTVRPGTSSGEEVANAVFGTEGEPTETVRPDTLVTLITANIDGGWDLTDQGFAISEAGGRIVAVTTPEAHAKVEAFLNDLRRFMKLTVHVEARFISLERGFLQDIGVDFRGLGGTNPGSVALLDDVVNGSPYFAGTGISNNGPGLPAAQSLSPVAGAFFANGTNDLRAVTEGVFENPLGSLLNGDGGATVAFSILDDTQLNAIFTGVEQNLDTSVITAPRLTIFNGQRANLTLVSQVSYVKDFDVEVAQTAFIADPLVDIVQDGLTLDVKPTVSHDRKYVTMEVRPTVATLLRPIRTFESSLAGITTPVVIELPEIRYSRAETTVRVPDEGYVVIGGLKHVRTIDRRSEVPFLSDIPLLGFLFSRKGRSDEIRDLIIVMHVRIIDLSELEDRFTR